MKTEKLTIFVVDDSPVALAAITNELQRTIHCNVKGFTSAEDCIFRMEDGLPDLVFSDYYLDALYERRMNGDQMLARIKVKYPHIPVIMYSSQNSVEVVIRLMKLGAVDFISKEKNFVKTISEIASSQIKKIKTEYETQWIARGMVFTLIAFLAALVIIRAYSPDFVMYFFIGVFVSLGVLLAFAVSKKTQGHQSSEDAN